MSSKSVEGSLALGDAIKNRRNELKLTIEEAASKAGVGTKTWSRYEAGASIRQDKIMGICRALNWHAFPEEKSDSHKTFDVNEYRKSKAWSQYLAENFDDTIASLFVIGSDMLLDDIKQDIQELDSMPRGSHIGEIDVSWSKSSLPPQFLMRYDYDFLYMLKAKIIGFRRIAGAGQQVIANSVIEALTLYLIMEEAVAYIEITDSESDLESSFCYDSWAFDIFDDMDIVTFLYSGLYLDSSNPYHFDHWLDNQFYCECGNNEEHNEKQ